MVEFTAQIKTINTKQLVSGDYSTDIVLRIDNARTDVLNTLNEINTTDGVNVCLTGSGTTKES